LWKPLVVCAGAFSPVVVFFSDLFWSSHGRLVAVASSRKPDQSDTGSGDSLVAIDVASGLNNHLCTLPVVNGVSWCVHTLLEPTSLVRMCKILDVLWLEIVTVPPPSSIDDSAGVGKCATTVLHASITGAVLHPTASLSLCTSAHACWLDCAVVRALI
jgi:hypothetical protein